MTFVDVSRSGRSSNYARQRILLDVHVVGLLCLVGFLGNAVTIAVLRRDWQDGSSATNWLLRSLAGVDTFYLVACVFIQTFKTAHDLTDWFPDIIHFHTPPGSRLRSNGKPACTSSSTETISTETCAGGNHRVK